VFHVKRNEIRLFVTGTDTGVGKTHVASALCREGVARGWTVIGHKPIETGCRSVDGRKHPEDALALAEASGGWQSGTALCQYMLELPAAPAVAARREGVSIDLDRIAATIREISANRQLTLIEGAGGWRVPISDREDMAALARRLGFPVLVVARAGLGTINHTLLTIEAAQRDGCEVWGAVLSALPSDAMDLARSNRDEIAERVGCPVWLVDPPAILDRSNTL
jgi:dethiobiotin synthetase